MLQRHWFSMLLLACPTWQWKRKRMFPVSSWRTPPKPVIPGLPFEVPSMLYFKKPFGGGFQNSLTISIMITFLSRPCGMRPYMPHCLRILNSASEGGFLGRSLTMVSTISLSCFKICSNRWREGFFSPLKIILFHSFHTFHIMKLGKRAQVELRTS